MQEPDIIRATKCYLASNGIAGHREAQAGITYTVTLAPNLRDMFEQTLAEPAVFTIAASHPPPPLPPHLFVPKRSHPGGPRVVRLDNDGLKPLKWGASSQR